MASKTRYTEEFKKKVVEEYKKGDLSLEEIATKYGLPPALLQDWVNKDDVNNILSRIGVIFAYHLHASYATLHGVVLKYYCFFLILVANKKPITPQTLHGTVEQATR